MCHAAEIGAGPLWAGGCGGEGLQPTHVSKRAGALEQPASQWGCAAAGLERKGNQTVRR